MNNILKHLKNNIHTCPTPAYIFDISGLNERLKTLSNSLPQNTKLCYAIKANPFLTETLSKLVDRLEVCSPGEYEICIQKNISPDIIVVSGVNKTLSSMARILSYSNGRGFYTIESPTQYNILKEAAHGLDNRIQVFLRLSSGNQFGMDENTLTDLIRIIQSDNIMDIKGIHYYGGTQKTEKKMANEIQVLNMLGESLQSMYGLYDLELEYGPGLPVTYFTDDEKADHLLTGSMKELDNCISLLSNLDSYSHITIELGRYLVAYCGYYLTKIMDIKQTKKTNYIIVDGGIHQLSYYGQILGMKKPFTEHIHLKPNDHKEYQDYTICGSLCTANDILVKQLPLASPAIGDLLVFERCGAYSITESISLFLSRELPGVMQLMPDGSIKVLRELTKTHYINS